MNTGILGNAKPPANTATLATSGLTITKAGDWAPQAPPQFFNLVSPQAVQFGNTFARYSGKWIAGWFYGESSWVAGQNRITSLTFEDLEGTTGAFTPVSMAALTTLSAPNLSFVGGNFSPNTMAALTTLSAPNLSYVGSAFQPASMASLTTLSLPNLRYVGGNFSLNTMAALTALSLPNLSYVGSGFQPNAMASLTTLSFPNLSHVGSGFQPSNMASLTTLSLPNLSFVGGNFSPSLMAALTTLSLPNLSHVAGQISFSSMGALTTISFPALSYIAGFINSAISMTTGGMTSLTTLSLPAVAVINGSIASTAPALANVTLPTNGTLKNVASSISITGAALTQTSVNNILQALASLDGTNGTTSYGTGRTVNISGGTSSAPSNAGSVNVTLATSPTLPNLVCSGTTCTVNLTAHGYAVGDVLRVTGVTGATNANRYAAVVTAPNANQFTYTTANTATPTNGAGTANIVKANNDAKALVTRGVTLTTN